MSRLFVRAGWESFWKAVGPPGAPPVQLQETRRAFYAGVFYALTTLTKEIGPESVTEDEGVAVLECAYQECLRFQQDVKAGRA